MLCGTTQQSFLGLVTTAAILAADRSAAVSNHAALPALAGFGGLPQVELIEAVHMQQT